MSEPKPYRLALVPGSQPNEWVIVCNTCGAVVMDKDVHTRWHEETTEALSIVAQRAYHADAMTRPIGSSTLIADRSRRYATSAAEVSRDARAKGLSGAITSSTDTQGHVKFVPVEEA